MDFLNIKILSAIVLPPLSIFMTKGVSPALIINILLTPLGWFPGSIHALWLVSKQVDEANA